MLAVAVWDLLTAAGSTLALTLIVVRSASQVWLILARSSSMTRGVSTKVSGAVRLARASTIVVVKSATLASPSWLILYTSSDAR